MTAPLGLVECVELLHEEAGGMLDVRIIRHADVPSLLARALAGDLEASQALSMAERVIGGIQRAPRRRPMLCGACPGPLRNSRYAVVLALPARDDPTNGISFAICHKCGTSQSALERAAQTALQRIWPKLRKITVTHAGGGVQ